MTRLKRLLCSCLFLTSVCASADEPPSTLGTGNAADVPAHPIFLAGNRVLTSHGLLIQLQSFMREREVEPSDLSADEMVRLMVDWFRFAPVGANSGAPSADALVFRYGGWSEGCATAFKLSVLRRVTPKDAAGGETELLAGITLMFEPSKQAELFPFSTASTDWKSVDAFLQAVESSPAFRILASTKPMSAMIESGGLR